MKSSRTLGILSGLAALAGCGIFVHAKGTAKAQAVTNQRSGIHPAELQVPDAALDTSPFLMQASHPNSPMGERGPGVPDFGVQGDARGKGPG
jgi:hypothetical protein